MEMEQGKTEEIIGGQRKGKRGGGATEDGLQAVSKKKDAGKGGPKSIGGTPMQDESNVGSTGAVR